MSDPTQLREGDLQTQCAHALVAYENGAKPEDVIPDSRDHMRVAVILDHVAAHVEGRQRLHRRAMDDAVSPNEWHAGGRAACDDLLSALRPSEGSTDG